MKKYWYLIIIVAVALTYLYFNNFYHSVEGFEITIENLTDNNIEPVYLTCNGITKDIEVKLSPSEKKVISVKPKNYGENSITLYYFNKAKAKKEHIIVGYFEESYGNGYAIVKINSISEDGTLDISSKYRLKGLIGLGKWN